MGMRAENERGRGLEETARAAGPWGLLTTPLPLSTFTFESSYPTKRNRVNPFPKVLRTLHPNLHDLVPRAPLT